MNVMILGGAGTIGSAAAAWLAARGIAGEVVLLDSNREAAESHAMDLSQAIFCTSQTRVRAGVWSDLARCGLLIVAAGLPAALATHDYCKDMNSLMPLIQEIAENLARYNSKAVVLSMTNPLDAFNYMLYEISGLTARQFIALSQNDSLRLRWALGEHLRIDPARIDAYVAGEHGPGKVPMFSTVTMDAAPLSLSQEDRAAVSCGLDDWWMHFLEVSGSRTAGWTSGAAAAQVAETMTGKRKGPICCSCILTEGQGYSMGWPVYLDQGGVTQPAQLALEAAERRAIDAQRAQLKQTQEKIKAYICAAVGDTKEGKQK